MIDNKIKSKTVLLLILKLALESRECSLEFRIGYQKKLYKLYALHVKLRNSKETAVNRRFWVRDIFTDDQRYLQGASTNLIIEMRNHDHDKFFNFFRMSVQTFDELLTIVAPQIKKQSHVRQAIPPRSRLEVTLRYLASGDSMASLAFLFRIAPNTISKIIKETCQVMWNCLKDVVFLKPSEENWRKIANEFEERWNFKNCIGAIDGKHVVMQALPNSGSKYYNYKGSHSLNLLGIADANYRFLMVNIGAEGRLSDSGIFRNSELGKGFENKLLNLPPPENNLPYVLVGDEAFQLTEYLMRPYPRKGNLDMRKKVFNYRLSRARRIIENAFGLLVARWRIFRKPIIAAEDTVTKIIQACVCLHNYILIKDPQQCNEYFGVGSSTMDCVSSDSEGLVNLGRTGSNFYGVNAANIRERFANFFCSEGAVEWQWEKALQNDF